MQKDDPNASASAESQHKVEIEWHTALENLLCEEAEKCAGLSWLHGKSEMYYSIQHNRLQIPMIILSTLVGAASVGSNSLFGPGNAVLSSMSLGAISIVVSILGLLNTHYAFSKRAEGHKLGSVQYAQIHRMIHIEMSLPRTQRMPPKQILRYIKEDLKRLMETLPRPPEHIVEQYKKEVIPNSIDVSHPDITNGVHHVEPCSMSIEPMESPIRTPALSPPPISIQVLSGRK